MGQTYIGELPHFTKLSCRFSFSFEVFLTSRNLNVKIIKWDLCSMKSREIILFSISDDKKSFVFVILSYLTFLAEKNLKILS